MDMAKTILVVDDEPDVIESMKNILERRGYSVLTALNGMEGLQRIKKGKPDLIITDVLMPEMDGYKFYKELKKNTNTINIPVIIVTARGQMEDTFKVVGVDGFITKPFSPQDLCAEIESLLNLVGTQPGSAPVKQRPKKILVVGKEQFILDDMARHAQKAGYEIITTTSGADAITKTVQFVPDIIVVDVQIPDISIIELIDTFRRLPKFGAKPIVGYSYYKTEDLGDSLGKNKVLNIEEASQKFLNSGGSQYIGRFHEQNFIKAILESSSTKP